MALQDSELSGGSLPRYSGKREGLMVNQSGIPYSKFSKEVRRFSRIETVRSIARLSARLEPIRMAGDELPKLLRSIQPFALAGIARASITGGNDYRRRIPTEIELARLCSMFINIQDPDRKLPPGEQRLSAMLRKVAFEQFGEQYSPHENLARSFSLFMDHASGVPGALTADGWKDLLGVPFADFMRIGFMLNIALLNSSGVISRGLLASTEIAPLFGEVGAEAVLNVIDKHFAASLEEHSAWNRHKEADGREKWSPNSLQNRPLITDGTDLVGPIPHYLIDRISPLGLYFIGLDNLGPQFPHAIGKMFESYIGSQLGQLAFVTVKDEIPYTDGRDKKLSCDYFVIFDEVVVLVEVKAGRPTIDFRSGGMDGVDDAEKKVGQAYRQILTTSQLMDEGRAEFASIPVDRPRVGMIVTMEPFHLRQTALDSSAWLNGPVPVGVVSAHDLEVMIARCVDEAATGALILNAPKTETGGIDFPTAVESLALKRNALLDRAFDEWCTWPD